MYADIFSNLIHDKCLAIDPNNMTQIWSADGTEVDLAETANRLEWAVYSGETVGFNL